MEHCVTMSVPSKVDFEVGPSWGETKPLSDA
jgi:DNA polymerase I-like protein with 3'-5' exonuclease and polymerase domains